jgi:ATP-dependent DNA helicase RecG
LKTLSNEEKDHDIFSCPFILAIDKVYQKIRNLKYRYLPDGTLHPIEIVRYEPFNIREAINNCIAHQDYEKAGYINVVEFEDDRLIFTNFGDFIPGSIEKVIEQDAPEEKYRNPFLANAMFQLGLVETRGGGIKKNFNNQIKRYFPLPDYFFKAGKTEMVLQGKMLDEDFGQILLKNLNLSLFDIYLLDKVQKKKDITDDEFRHLKKLGLVEGRKHSVFFSQKVIKPIINEELQGELKAEYIKNKSFADSYYKDLILKYIKKWDEASRSEIDILLLDKLPDVLDEGKKKNKIKNLLQSLRKSNKIKLFKGKKWKLRRT